MDEEQQKAFKQAVERKQRAARKPKRGEETPPTTIEDQAPRDRGEQSLRTKSIGHSRER